MDPVLVQVVLVHLERTSFRKVADRLAQKRIFRVATELLQNMLHHALPATSCVFTVEVRRDRWTLVARNPLSVETGEKLAARWEELTSAPYEALRERERDALAEEVRSEHGGGGLGLYEILRRADGGVNCECLSFDNGTAAVEFTAHILIPHE
jgi:hypothetical protein